MMVVSGSPVRTVDVRGVSRDRALSILNTWARSPLARIATLPHYRYSLVAGERCVIPWLSRSGCALALGEPVGPAFTHREALVEFTAQARARGLDPVFAPVRRQGFRDLGYRLFPIGQTAKLNLAAFTLEGSSRRSLRQSARRGERAALFFAIWNSPDADQMDRLASVSEEWMSGKTLGERLFGTGRFEPGFLAGSRVGVVTNPFGRVEAFVSLVEDYSPGDVAVDLMRRRPDSPPGAMDLLLTRLALALRDEGALVLDLGLAPLAGMRHGVVERVLDWVYHHGGGYYDFSGVHRFKRKFAPDWQVRYLAYPSALVLPKALFALSEVRG